MDYFKSKTKQARPLLQESLNFDQVVDEALQTCENELLEFRDVLFGKMLELSTNGSETVNYLFETLTEDQEKIKNQYLPIME